MDEEEVMALLSANKRKREEANSSSSAKINDLNFEDAWSMDVRIAVPCSTTVHDHADHKTTVLQVPIAPIICTVRPLKCGDEVALQAFGLCGLSDESRRLFAPFNWSAPEAQLLAEFTTSVTNSQSRRDLHLIALAGDKICCHGFLWSMCDEVPEFGIAVADAWHGRGLARQMMTLLEKACVAAGKPAIELTTMQDNEHAHSVYLKAGYEDLGIIRNPLGVDVTAAFAGTVVATAFSDEFHMCRILDEQARERVLEAMAQKRRRAAALFGATKT